MFEPIANLYLVKRHLIRSLYKAYTQH